MSAPKSPDEIRATALDHAWATIALVGATQERVGIAAHQ